MGLLQWFINFLIKKTSGGTVKNEIISNKELAEQYLELGKGNVIFCCMVPTDPNFRQTKIIIIILISFLNISCFLLFML